MIQSEALEMLKSWGACRAGIDRVKGARTIELMIARASLSDLEWAIRQIGGKTRVDYAAATAIAWAACDAAIAPAIAPAWAAYDAAIASAWADYDAAIASAWQAAYNAARLKIARTLITAYVGGAR
jgi:hypothetical protein